MILLRIEPYNMRQYETMRDMSTYETIAEIVQQSVSIISSIHLSTTYTLQNISFTQYSSHGKTGVQQIDLLTTEWLHSSVG